MRAPRRSWLLVAAMVAVPSISCAGGKSALGAGGATSSAGGATSSANGAGSAAESANVEHAKLLAAGGKPVDGEVQTLEGQKVRLAELRGHPALLDFFATWCEPCRVGLPHTDAILQAHAAQGLAGWAISIDAERGPVAPFASKLGLKLPVRWDPDGKTADGLGVQLLPALLLLDATGAVRFRALPDDPDFDRHLDEAVEALLTEGARAARSGSIAR